MSDIQTLDTIVRGSHRISVEGANPFLSENQDRQERQADRLNEQATGLVGKRDNVPNDEKPDPSKITAGIDGCILRDCPEHMRKQFELWYGPNLHCCAIGSIKDDRYGRFIDGEQIRTSILVRDEVHEDGERYLYTLNSIYKVLS